MDLRPSDGKIIENYIKKLLENEISKEKIKELIKECMDESSTHNLIDDRNIYFCSYIDEKSDLRIGLFKRKDYFNSIKILNYNYSYNVYTGIDSIYEGIYCISNDPGHNERWLDNGEGFDDNSHTANCIMDCCLGNFDKFRQIWRRDNNITTSYDSAYTSNEEMTAVRDYITNNISKFYSSGITKKA